MIHRLLARAAAALTALIVLTALTGDPVAAQPALQIIKVAAIPSDIAGEIYYAKELGFFKKYGYDVEITPITNGAAISAAVASGAVDVGFSNVISLAIAHERGIPFTILAPAELHQPNVVTAGILTVKKDGPIKSAKDLNGKTIAVNGLRNIADAGVRAWVDKNGGDSKTLIFTEMPFPQMPAAVSTGRIDAASIDGANEAVLTKPDTDLRRLGNVFDAVSPHFAPATWFSTTTWTDAHPDEAKMFVAVMAQAAAWGNANHDKSADILAKYLNKSAADINAVTRAAYVSKLSPDLIQPSLDVALKYGIIKSPIAAPAMISPLSR